MFKSDIEGYMASLPQAEKDFIDRLRYEENVIIFGAGFAGRNIKSYLEQSGINVSFFCDNNPEKWETTVDNLPVYSPDRIVSMDNQSTEVLIASHYFYDIIQQLKSMKFYNYQVISGIHIAYSNDHFDKKYLDNSFEELGKVYELLTDEDSKKLFVKLIAYRLTGNPSLNIYTTQYKQYFHPIVSPGAGQCIIDAGAFTGDTAKEFLRYLNKECKIYCFEPSPENFLRLESWVEKENLRNYVIPLKYGVSSRTEILRFNTALSNAEQCCISDDGDLEIHAMSLDEYFMPLNEKVDLIKMDIEGSELEALKGAQNIIKRWKPALQICVYHKYNDLFEIPLFISRLFEKGKYRFYLGNHGMGFMDTVLYGFPTE